MFTSIRKKYANLVTNATLSEIFTGSAWALSARVIATALGLVFNVIIARFYGAETVGILAVINSFLILITIFTLLGTGTSILRLIPEHIAKYSPKSAFKIYRKTQYIVIFISLITGTLSYMGANLIAVKVFSKPHLSYYFALASVFVVFKSLMLFNTQAIRGLRLIRMFALMQFLPQLISLLLLLIFGMLISNMNVPVYALLGGFALNGLAGWLIMEKSFKEIISPNDPVTNISASNLMSLSLPMFLTTSVTFAVGQSGVIILGIFRSEAEVGYFFIAVKLATLVLFIISAINSMAASSFSELYHSGKLNEVIYVAKKASKIIFWTTFPILLMLILFGKLIISILFGADFEVAYLAMVFIAIGQFFTSATGSTGTFMNMTGSHKALLYINAFTMLINVTLCLLLVPVYGFYGASIAVMVGMFVLNGASLVFIKIKHGAMIGYLPGFERS